jgi:predicted PurR-regulated permease PerM
MTGSPLQRLPPARQPVPVRSILACIGLVLATVAALYVILEIRQVLTWMMVAAFFSVALAPVVGWVQERAFGQRRALATLLVFVLVLLGLSARIHRPDLGGHSLADS